MTHEHRILCVSPNGFIFCWECGETFNYAAENPAFQFVQPFTLREWKKLEQKWKARRKRLKKKSR